MTKEWRPESLLKVLGDDYAGKILVLARRRPMSATELAERCETSLPTVYRRVNVLVDYGLLSEETRIDTAGNNYTMYATTVDAVLIEVGDDDLEIRLRPSGLVDRFERFWRSLEWRDSDE